MKLALAACAPPAPPADRLPVALRLLPQLIALRLLPQLAALPVVLRLLPQLIAPPVVLQRFRQMGKSTSNYGPVLCFFGQSSRKKVSKSAAFCQLCTFSRAKTVSLGKTLYEV